MNPVKHNNNVRARAIGIAIAVLFLAGNGLQVEASSAEARDQANKVADVIVLYPNVCNAGDPKSKVIADLGQRHEVTEAVRRYKESLTSLEKDKFEFMAFLHSTHRIPSCFKDLRNWQKDVRLPKEDDTKNEAEYYALGIARAVQFYKSLYEAKAKDIKTTATDPKTSEKQAELLLQNLIENKSQTTTPLGVYPNMLAYKDDVKQLLEGVKNSMSQFIQAQTSVVRDCAPDKPAEAVVDDLKKFVSKKVQEQDERFCRDLAIQWQQLPNAKDLGADKYAQLLALCYAIQQASMDGGSKTSSLFVALKNNLKKEYSRFDLSPDAKFVGDAMQRVMLFGNELQAEVVKKLGEIIHKTDNPSADKSSK